VRVLTAPPATAPSSVRVVRIVQVTSFEELV
jgi:hypothetical protein